MAISSLSLRLLFLFSLCLSRPACSLSPRTPKAKASDLLSLLGTHQQSTSVNSNVSEALRDCFKFLVPFEPTEQISFSGQDNNNKRRSLLTESEENELIWRPPQSVLDLAHIGVNSSGSRAAIIGALNHTNLFPVPDIEGCNADGCSLCPQSNGKHFISEELNSYMRFLFELIVKRGPSVDLEVALTRYDLFHGHLFLANDTGRPGILFHAKEYPLFNDGLTQGNCDTGTNIPEDDMLNLRNILWLAPLPNSQTREIEAPGVLVVLDAHPSGIIYRDIMNQMYPNAKTVDEGKFGVVPLNIDFLNVGGGVYQLFITNFP